MRKLFLFLLISICSAQVTPHIGLNVPVHGTPNYDVQLNANFEALDSFLSGGSALPGMVGCTVNNTLYVGGLCAATWGGGDIGSQINAAYATLPNGGMIQVLPNSVAYTFTTPIVLLGSANPVTLNCNPGANGYQTITGGTILNYTPSTGIALTVAGSIGSQVNGCTLVGPGPTTTAIGMLVGGPTTGDSSILSFFNSNNISNFGVGLQFGNFSFLDSFTNDWIHDNGPNGGDKNVYVPAGLSNFGENVSFIGGAITNNPLVSSYSPICVDILSGGSIKFYGLSFDQCGVTINTANGILDFHSDHFEAPNYSTTADYVTIGPLCSKCAVNTFGGDFYEGIVSARTEFINEASTQTNNANSVSITGTAFTPAETGVYAVKATGSATCCQRIAVRDYGPPSTAPLLLGPIGGTWLGTIFEYAGNVTASGSLTTGPLVSVGLSQAVLTGTGACGTITTQVGGQAAGSAKCTGSTAGSTLTITPGITAPNGWICNVQDETTRANLFQQTSYSTTACVLTVTSVTANDVFVFSAIAF